MKENIKTITDDYKQRFNEMYKLKYDLNWLDTEIPQEVSCYIKQLISEKFLDIEDSKILDLGCGRGKLLCYLEQEKFKNTVGVDVSDVAVKLAQKNTKTSNILVADILKGLPFQDNTFSLVTELIVLSSFNPNYWSVMLDEIYRVLKIKGFYISEIFLRDKKYNVNDLLINKATIPKELDQVYGVTKKRTYKYIQ